MVDVLLYNKLIAELGGAEKVKVVAPAGKASRQERPHFKLLGCNHCVACCDPEVPTEPCGLRHLKHLVHHALPNLPAKRRQGILSLGVLCPPLDAAALAERAYRASGETESAHGLPSMLRRRRQRGLLKGDLAPLRLPRAYTNIPDYYSELLVVQHEIRKQSPKPAHSTTNSAGEEASGSVTVSSSRAGEEAWHSHQHQYHHPSRFRVEYLGHEQSGQNTLLATTTTAARATAAAVAGGSLKRSFSNLMEYGGGGEAPMWQRKLARSISVSSSESSEFCFDHIYPDGDREDGEERAAFKRREGGGFGGLGGGCGGPEERGGKMTREEIRYPAKIRFKNLLASYRKLGEIINSKGHGLALTS
mmetsp:Transcript_11563/g.29280  ORF Transcript_11563/g.29280 Transcript_11563/m.29280 type:complete len:361 (-) Transcript_11563:106-1188(-)